MSQGCPKDRENLQILKDYDKTKTRLYEGWIDKTFGKRTLERNQEVAEQLAKEGYDAHTFITESEVDAAAIRAFGKKRRREFLAWKLGAIIESNPGIMDIMYAFMKVKIPQSVRMGKKVRGVHKVTGPIQLNFERFPESTLTLFINKSLNLINATNNSGKASAKIGNWYSQFKTPKSLKWMGMGGAAFESIATGVRDHAGRISSRINLFMSSPSFIPLKSGSQKLDKKTIKAAKVGMEKILSKIDGLDKLSEHPNEYREEKFQKLFAATMKGWVKIKDGKFYIHKNYTPRAEYLDEQTGKWIEFFGAPPKNVEMRLMTYPSTGDVMWSFKNLVPMKSHKFLNNKESFYLDMNETQLKRFQEYMIEARNITDAVFEYIVPEMENSTNELMDGLISHYEGKFGNRKFNEYAIKQIFFYDTTEIFNDDNDAQTLAHEHPGYKIEYTEDGRPYVNLLQKLDDIDKGEINTVKETFAMTMSDSLVIANGGAIREDTPEWRQNYWPTIYNPDVYRRMLEKLRKDLIGLIDDVKKQLESPDLSKVNEKYLKKYLKQLQASFNSADTILDNMDGYHVDNATGSLLHYASDNKHFKRISNAYDIRSSRLDKGVFYDYLKNMMASVERNNLNLYLLETLRRLKSDRKRTKPKIDPEEADAVRRTAVNYHRTTYSSVKTAGILGDFESYTRTKNYVRMFWPPNWARMMRDRKFKGHYSVNVSPEMQSRYSRWFTTGLSGKFLMNWKSALTNFSGAYENVIMMGIKTTKNAFNLYNDPLYRDGIRKIIQQSGITEFSDFFSRAMVNGILKLQVESQVSEQVLKEMIKYHKRIGTYATDDKGKRFKYTKKKSRDKFNEDVVKWLSQSDLWMEAEKVVIRKTPRLQAQQREVKSRMRLYAANKLVQWAINKEYAMKPLIKDRTWGQWAFLPFGSAAVKMSQLYKFAPITMSNTEKIIRSVSFIIGAENAWKNSVDGLRNDIHWSEYTDQQDIDNVINLGREYSYEFNFGMSTQDVAQYQFGPAQGWGKFKYWSQQKWEADWGKWDSAIESLQKIDSEGNQNRKFGFKVGPMLTLLKKVNTPGLMNQKNRIANPEIAALRTMWLSQGITSLLWNLFMFNPLNLRHLGTGVGSTISAIKSVGFQTGISMQLRNYATSDLMSFVTLPLALAIKSMFQGFFGGDDEMEDIDRTLAYWLRKVPFAGYLVTWTYTAIMALIAAGEDEELFAKKLESVLSIFYGRPQIMPFNFLSTFMMEKGRAGIQEAHDALD